MARLGPRRYEARIGTADRKPADIDNEPALFFDSRLSNLQVSTIITNTLSLVARSQCFSIIDDRKDVIPVRVDLLEAHALIGGNGSGHIRHSIEKQTIEAHLLGALERPADKCFTKSEPSIAGRHKKALHLRIIQQTQPMDGDATCRLPVYVRCKEERASGRTIIAGKPGDLGIDILRTQINHTGRHIFAQEGLDLPHLRSAAGLHNFKRH